jgi:hypothetical protein
MSVYDSLRTAIATALDGVPNTGVVHDRERFVVDLSRYLELFKTTIGGVSQIRGWLVLRESAHPIPEDVFGEVRRRHLFVLYGVLGFQDSTDTYGTMQALCDAVMATFDDATTLGVAGVVVRTVGPCALRSFKTEQFGSVLCHAAEIELPVDVMLPIGTA